MNICRQVTRESLTNPIDIPVKDKDLNLSEARSIADQKAAEMAETPMLLGWYDRAANRFSPNVECCSEKKPGWIVYAETRGGNITIDINQEEYVFIYRDISTG